MIVFGFIFLIFYSMSTGFSAENIKNDEYPPSVLGNLWSKRVTVYHEDETHYYDIPVSTDIPENLGGVELYRYLTDDLKQRVTDDPDYTFQVMDTDENGKNDTVSWVIPELSEVSFSVEGVVLEEETIVTMIPETETTTTSVVATHPEIEGETTTTTTSTTTTHPEIEGEITTTTLINLFQPPEFGVDGVEIKGNITRYNKTLSRLYEKPFKTVQFFDSNLSRVVEGDFDKKVYTMDENYTLCFNTSVIYEKTVNSIYYGWLKKVNETTEIKGYFSGTRKINKFSERECLHGKFGGYVKPPTNYIPISQITSGKYVIQAFYYVYEPNEQYFVESELIEIIE